MSLRPVAPTDLMTIERWSAVAREYMTRTRPHGAASGRHDPAAGLHWYIIVNDGRDTGTVWVEETSDGREAVLGVFLGREADCDRGIGTAAVRLAVREFRRDYPGLPITLHVRHSNVRAVACYRNAGFVMDGGGCKSLPSGEIIAFYRMVLPAE